MSQHAKPPKQIAVVNAQYNDQEEEALTNALKEEGDFETAATILNKVSDILKLGKQTLEKAFQFFTCLKQLSDVVRKVMPQLQPVCEFLFDFTEQALMKYLTRHHKENIAIKQAWPVEWAQVDTILTCVKKELEAVDKEFKEAMEIVKTAVSLSDPIEITKALKKYGAIQSNIQPVFETCLKNIEQAQTILETLGPSVGKVIQSYRDKAINVSVSVPLVAAAVAYYFREAWVYVASVALIIFFLCFQFAIKQRSELRNGLAYYHTEIRLIMRTERMKGQLTSGQAFLSGLKK